DEISFIIPNIFTPNGDNNNDNFVIQITGANLIEELNVEVFNRWGEKIKNAEFSPFDSAQGANSQHLTPNTQYTIWDGRTTAGAICPEGTYFYVLNYTTTAGATETLKGSLTVLR
ncbi:MAG: gliding motility-associated C-terminal domain-containing protein, partial [Vicingaceae bacterium]